MHLQASDEGRVFIRVFRAPTCSHGAVRRVSGIAGPDEAAGCEFGLVVVPDAELEDADVTTEVSLDGEFVSIDAVGEESAA